MSTPRSIASTILVAAAATAAAAQTPAPLHQMFVPSDRCISCHNGVVSSTGEDVSIGADWRSAIMAHSARDPYWQASIRREAEVHPEAAAVIENECSKCHMPMSSTEERAAGGQGEVFSHLSPTTAQGRADHLAADGVSCAICHRIEPDGLGEEESFSGGYVVSRTVPIRGATAYGPYEVDEGRTRLMRSAAELEPGVGNHVQSAELCASCHTLFTHTLGPDGSIVGELPEQVPYLEWKHSDFEGVQTCQDCHMPTVHGEVALTSVVPQPRENVSRHVFRGGNFFLARMMNRYRDELGIEAQPQELETTARRTAEHLRTASAEIAVENVRHEGDRLLADVVVLNYAGHKLPSAYPSRRAWLHVTVTDANRRTVFESGSFRPDGSIAGNANDADPRAYEPHYREITTSDQVQIYEPILVTPSGEVTTVLLSASDYGKDNRLLPAGFDKRTAGDDIAVHGEALADDDFSDGGDTVRNAVPVGDAPGPFTVTAELWYQPIGFRWAHNLEEQPTELGERFVGYYEAMSDESAIVLAEGSRTTD